MMPVVMGFNRLVYCPLKKGLVPVERCYSCSHYIKRDMMFVFCWKELEEMFGSFEIVKRSPFMVKTKDGKVYRYVPENDLSSSVVFVEVRTGAVKKIPKPPR